VRSIRRWGGIPMTLLGDGLVDGEKRSMLRELAVDL
jgi:hypothetical protein